MRLRLGNTPDTWRRAWPPGKRTDLTDGGTAMEFTWLSRWQPQLLALLRIVAGLLFLEHGTVKFLAFPIPFPGPSPLPPLLMAAGAIEIVAGILIALGLF